MAATVTLGNNMLGGAASAANMRVRIETLDINPTDMCRPLFANPNSRYKGAQNVSIQAKRNDFL